MTPYFIKTILFPSGERLPILIEKESGMPDYWSTLFVITHSRANNLSPNTIEQILRHLIILKIYLKYFHSEVIDLEQRFKKGLLLHTYEIESLCDICKMRLEDLNKMCISTNYQSKEKNPVTFFEAVRSSNSREPFKSVNEESTANRIRTIRDYLVWLSTIYLSRLNERDIRFQLLKDSIDSVKSTLTARIPNISHNTFVDAPKGLSKEAIEQVFNIIKRNSEDNPWKNIYTQVRNELLILWIYQFGLRRSEVLNLKISDIDFRSITCVILRRPNDPSDPRKNQPRVKTGERKLDIPKKLLSLTQDYILNYRTHLPESKKHEYLFVAAKSGKPMSLDTLNKVFSQLKSALPNLTEKLTPHILRHTWNDNFSALMDKNDYPEEKEKQMRSYLMGWSKTSHSAAVYTQRHIQKKANEAILDLGNIFFKAHKL